MRKFGIFINNKKANKIVGLDSAFLYLIQHLNYTGFVPGCASVKFMFCSIRIANLFFYDSISPENKGFMIMSIEEIAPGKQPPKNMNAIIEVPENGHVKYEIDKATGLPRVDRILHTPMAYPANYGYFPGTLGDDGDPLELCVIRLCAQVLLSRFDQLARCLWKIRPVVMKKLFVCHVIISIRITQRLNILNNCLRFCVLKSNIFSSITRIYNLILGRGLWGGLTAARLIKSLWTVSTGIGLINVRHNKRLRLCVHNL